MSDDLRRKCPYCEELCDPVTNEADKPFAISGQGIVYLCPTHHHWTDGQVKARKHRMVKDEQIASGDMDPRQRY